MQRHTHSPAAAPHSSGGSAFEQLLQCTQASVRYYNPAATSIRTATEAGPHPLQLLLLLSQQQQPVRYPNTQQHEHGPAAQQQRLLLLLLPI
jgi:hypothetical protein